MKIKNVHLNNLRNGEHFQLHTDFKNLVEKFTPEKLSIKEAFAKYLLLYAHEDEVFWKTFVKVPPHSKYLMQILRGILPSKD